MQMAVKHVKHVLAYVWQFCACKWQRYLELFWLCVKLLSLKYSDKAYVFMMV